MRTTITSLIDKIKVWPHYLLPQHTLSRIILYLTRTSFSKLFINRFIKSYNINMLDARHPDSNYYRHFNAFFTRELKPNSRPFSSQDEHIISPVDGCISEWGHIEHHTLYQAKGQSYQLTQLLADDTLSHQFQGGQFATLYLSPKDYHRIHMPITGTLKQMIHVPGKLFSVNPASVRTIPALFARNERIICIFDTPWGEMAMILVGAIFVASIETIWHGVVTPPSQKHIQRWSYTPTDNITLERGTEMGRFNMGSTVILLFNHPDLHWNTHFHAGSHLYMGNTIAMIDP